MDFGGSVGLDGGGGGLCSDSVFASTTTDNSSETAKQKWYGSGFLKQERSGSAADDDFSHLKLAKTSDGSDFSSSRPTTTPTTTSPLLRSDCTFLSDGQQMLCFSQSDPQTAALPYYYHASGGYGRNTGYGAGNLNVSSMHGVITGIRGPFTPSQWMELEHQALIYKYITANVPIPSHLLIPIRKALDSVGFSGLRPNPLGWGAFHLGFSNNSDPEPGRCRRTDGKKWRCSRDAVPDSKYCERHMNRGRHRSRKPVEGQTTAAAAAATHHVSGAAATSAGKPSTVASSPGVMGPAASTGLAGHQISNLQTGASLQLNRNFSNDGEILELSPAFGLKQNQSEFGLVSSDSLLNPLQKTSTLIKEPNNPQTKSEHHSLRQFMDDWPPNNNNNNQTELSISIPITTSDFITSSNDKLALSPLRLSNQRQPPNWIPVSWEGGPLGEVLHNGGVAGEWKDRSTAALNLMTEGWDSGTSLASSPTGVLQKTAFGSLSNSSAGSSPRTETGMCNNQIHRHSWPALN